MDNLQTSKTGCQGPQWNSKMWSQWQTVAWEGMGFSKNVKLSYPDA